MKRMCYLGMLKEGFSAYSSPVILISRKMTQDKRVVTDFRHLNIHIAKNNLAYQLLKDTCTLLSSSRCKVLSVLDLKDAFEHGFEHFPCDLQSYINAILDCLQSRKYRKAIMDDLLLFTPTKTCHFAKLVDLLKALHKNGLKVSPKKCQCFKTELQYMGNTIFIKDKRACVKP